jgi:elongation factor G
VGVARLTDFIAKYVPPVDRAKVATLDRYRNQAEIMLTNSEQVVQVFKTINEEHFGELSFFREYSGTVRAGFLCR